VHNLWQNIFKQRHAAQDMRECRLRKKEQKAKTKTQTHDKNGF
jgi:hypothetical protein